MRPTVSVSISIMVLRQKKATRFLLSFYPGFQGWKRSLKKDGIPVQRRGRGTKLPGLHWMCRPFGPLF
jgi:hypothetical protein